MDALEQSPHAFGQESRIYNAFLIGVMLKGLNGLLEIVAGSILVFTNITGLVRTFVENQLIDDPNDFFATHLAGFVNMTPHTRIFAGIYLLGHGIVKAIFAVGLLKNYAWAYPTGIVFLGLFIMYDIYRVVVAHSIVFACLFVFDAAILWLVWHEYRRLHEQN